MADAVRFHFDPLCPWCYQTSRWALRLEELGELDLSWGVFSLELNGFPKAVEAFDPDRARAGAALRTAVLVRDEHGERACGAYYAALGRRYFQDLEDLHEPAVLDGALRDAGLDPGLRRRAVEDAATWAAVVAEHQALVAEVGGFGVPTLRLDGGAGPAVFGPVVSEPPGDDEARELWSHVRWLARSPNFHELKRERASGPDLPYWHRFVAERRAAGGGS